MHNFIVSVAFHMFSPCGFFQVLGSEPPPPENMLGDGLAIWVWMSVWKFVHSVFLPHIQCSWNRLWIHLDPDQDNAITEDEWMNVYNIKEL